MTGEIKGEGLGLSERGDPGLSGGSGRLADCVITQDCIICGTLLLTLDVDLYVLRLGHFVVTLCSPLLYHLEAYPF